MHHLLAKSADRYPDKAAIAFKDLTITYGELDHESSKLAYVLSDIGIERGDRVGIHMNRSIDSIVGALGSMKAGATYIPIDPACPSDRFYYIIQKCEIDTLLTSHDKLSNIEQVFHKKSALKNIIVMNAPDAADTSRGPIQLFDWQDIRHTAKERASNAFSIDSDPAYILFTSGSTGNPKGVMISHLNSLTFINSAYDFFGIGVKDIFSNICPLHFDMSVFDIFVAFKSGASVVIVPETTAIFPSQLAGYIEKNRISVWSSVPSALSMLANFGKLENYDLSSLRLILFAGEVFPIKYLRRLMEAIPEAVFFNLYGQTEANSSTCYRVDHIPMNDSSVLPIGKPFPNFDVFAINEDGKKIVEPGEEGELYVRAASVAMGYFGDFEKTEENFVNNPLSPYLNERVYRTGDIVCLDTDRNYVFLGRKDHMIKSRGYRIEIGEIETVLCNHIDVKNAVVIPIPDELIGNRISVIIVPVDHCKIEKEDILKYCSTRLPKYMLPDIIEFRDTLPMTSSGKVDRKKMANMNGDDCFVR